ncbi:MAG: 5-amino-6-(D-ribitylamino)uracil--L-tyrosine 4-hydroxyphenyl transferase CofH [Sphingomonadaceae bacterium]
MTGLRDRLLSRPLAELKAAASEIRSARAGSRISYSRKLFLPVTHLCRDVCRYCVFARPPRPGVPAYLDEATVLATARRGASLGCREALFTLGDQPEARWPQARAALEAMGFTSTLDYVGHLARRVLDETGLLPHLNPGLMDEARLRQLRAVAPSMGIMLETLSPRLMARGGPHHGCPDKAPERRLAMLEAAGRARIPFTTGLLVGIGETRAERLEALEAIIASHARHGHVQEVIVQPFRAKAGTPMRNAAEPDADELAWTLAAARLILPPDIALQSPPNLSANDLIGLIEAGVDDLGGISPLTPDYVNPEAPWPHIDSLAARLAAHGFELVERLTVHPGHAASPERWIDPGLAPRIRALVDSEGWPREDDWVSGESVRAPGRSTAGPRAPLVGTRLSRLLDRALAGDDLDSSGIIDLFAARGAAFDAVCRAADSLRAAQAGDVVSFVVTRNINYTNVCSFGCRFCAFSKGKVAPDLRSAPYVVDLSEITRRAGEAWDRGATEVCLQGGIHPAFDGHSYREILAAARRGAEGLHVHAFSPLEIWHGARSLGWPVADYLADLRDRGLGSLPGTAAEILDDEVRRRICPDKIDSATWLEVIRAAHEVGLRTTATIMFGHVDAGPHWARHLLSIRDLQRETGGFTEFVPLPFVASEAPIFRRGGSRRGPTWREAVLMHAVARLVLGRDIPNIQVSWVKMGPEGAAACLEAGANDLGGTLMNESITRSAGARHGEEATPASLAGIAASVGRPIRQRTTLYASVDPGRAAAARAAAPLPPV